MKNVAKFAQSIGGGVEIETKLHPILKQELVPGVKARWKSGLRGGV